MKAVTMIKFMNQEELVNMLVQIKNFRHPVIHKAHHKNKTCEEWWNDPWTRAKSNFRMKNLDFLDPLMNETGGYVRYYGAQRDVLRMLEEVFGFELEEE